MVWWIAIVNGTAILIGMSLVSLTIQKAGAAFFSIGANLIPVFIALFSILIFGIWPTSYQIMGGVLIIISIWIFLSGQTSP